MRDFKVIILDCDLNEFLHGCDNFVSLPVIPEDELGVIVKNALNNGLSVYIIENIKDAES